jgi:hypothetical protein
LESIARKKCRSINYIKGSREIKPFESYGRLKKGEDDNITTILPIIMPVRAESASNSRRTACLKRMFFVDVAFVSEARCVGFMTKGLKP